MFFKMAVLKTFAIILRKTSVSFNKVAALRTLLCQSLFFNKIVKKKEWNIWWSCSRLLVSFVWSYNTYISLGIVKGSSAFGDQICFFFIFNIEKLKARITKQILTKVHRRNHYPKHVFSWVLLNPWTTSRPTNREPTTYPPTYRLQTNDSQNQ